MITLVFDLETKRLANEVGGWAHIDKMGFAAGVTYDLSRDAYAQYTEDQVAILIDSLYQADQIIGFNLVRFDYVVLHPYGFQSTPSMIAKSTDLLLDIYNALGFRISLDNLAASTLNETKKGNGLKSVEWYREGRIDRVLEYCQQDVRVTYNLWTFGAKHGYVSFSDRRGRITRVDVDWSGSV